jgi:hypothetical protein
MYSALPNLGARYGRNDKQNQAKRKEKKKEYIDKHTALEHLLQPLALPRPASLRHILSDIPVLVVELPELLSSN